MNKEAVGTCALLSSVVLLGQLGCTRVRIGQEANESIIAVNDLVKTTKSWDGKSLPPCLQGDQCQRADERRTYGRDRGRKDAASQISRSSGRDSEHAAITPRANWQERL